MACPQILFLAAFLLLLSFWVDLCHQANEEDDVDDENILSPLLAKFQAIPGSLHADGRRRFCSFRSIHIGSRQKFVILVVVLTFVFMISFAVLIWAGRGENPIDSPLMARVYLDIFSVAILLLGGAFACYGVLLFSKMRKVRSEMISTEMWKVVRLAAVSLVSFTSSAVLALVTNVPLQVHCYWHIDHSDSTYISVFSFFYYFIGSSVPTGFVLWVMREMPPRLTANRPDESRVITFIRDTPTTIHAPQWRNTVTSSQNKALKASPI